ncbi:MAG: hypothetical protein R6X19_02910 [Kiritimatiellia bacterium]
MLATLQTLLKKFDRTPDDVVGIDFGASGLKCVRLKQTPAGIAFVAADIFPPILLPEAVGCGALPALTLPKSLQAPYGALALSSEQAVIKVMSFPGEFSAETESQIIPHMGLEDPALFRVNYIVLVHGHARSESRLLAIGYPSERAAVAPRMIPTGMPAPCSIEIAGLATLTSFLHMLTTKGITETVGHLEIGEKTSLFALFTKGVPVLIRKLEFGVESVMHLVRQGLGVTPQVALDIVATGSIDITHWVNQGSQPFIKQLLLSRDFVERRENCRIRQFFLNGGGGGMAPLRKDIEQAFALEFALWNPLEAFISDGTPLPETIRGQEFRLTAATGAALAVLEKK